MSYARGQRVEVFAYCTTQKGDAWLAGEIVYADRCEVHVKLQGSGVRASVQKADASTRIRRLCINTPATPCACLLYADCMPPGLEHTREQ